MKTELTVCALVALAALPVDAGGLTGRARVVDGDTLEVAGQMVRLHGIDAPESAQTCRNASGAPWDCGTAAARLLTALTAGRTLRCSGGATDAYDRRIAVCTVAGDGVDLGAALVAEGLAVAYTKYSDDYLPLQRLAEKAGKGLWSGDFMMPADYRQKRWATAETVHPDGCPIKGNISSRGRIYHTPYSRWYTRTRIDPSRGERWFCSEREALDAGWRAPMN